jgi:hypothetical protein
MSHPDDSGHDAGHAGVVGRPLRSDDGRRHHRFDQFSAANTSLARVLLERVGGFDARFVGYGWEDYEIGLRLLEAEVRIGSTRTPSRGTSRSGARPSSAGCAGRRGATVVRFVHRHPDRLCELIGQPRPLLLVLARVLVRLRPVLALLVAVGLPAVEVLPNRGALRWLVRLVSPDVLRCGRVRTGWRRRVTAALLSRAAAAATSGRPGG